MISIAAAIALPGLWNKHTKGIEKMESLENEAQDARDAAAYLWSLRVNPATGTIDVNDMINARNQVDAMAANNHNERMKSSSINLSWEELGPDNIGGRTRAILFDRNNPNLMFAGSVAA